MVTYCRHRLTDKDSYRRRFRDRLRLPAESADIPGAPAGRTAGESDPFPEQDPFQILTGILVDRGCQLLDFDGLDYRIAFRIEFDKAELLGQFLVLVLLSFPPIRFL